MTPPSLLRHLPSTADSDRPLDTSQERSSLAVDQPMAGNPVQHVFFVVLPALIGFFGLLALILIQVLISKDFLEE